MTRKRKDLTPEVRDKIAQDYRQGAKTLVIETEYKISPGELYRILHRKGLTLRKAGRGGDCKSWRAPQPLRPKCNSCGREYDPGLTKKGLPNRVEKLCWMCSGWAADCRGNREVYNQDGSKITPREIIWGRRRRDWKVSDA